MFRKIVSNLPFSPALVGQLGFYAKRLRKEEVTRRLGLVFVVLTLIVQSIAVFQPPESANASNQNDFISGGIKSLNNFLSPYDSNTNHLKDIMNYAGITRSEIAAAKFTSWKVADKLSWGFSPRFSWAQGERQHDITNTSGGKLVTVYSRPLKLWHGANVSVDGWAGHSDKMGWFAIMKACGNLVTDTTPKVIPLAPEIIKSKTATNTSQGFVDASTVVAKSGDQISYTITVENKGTGAAIVELKENLADVLEYSSLTDAGGGTLSKETKVLSWPSVTLKPDAKQSRTFVVKLLSTIPSTAKGASDGTSYDCIMTNTFGNSIDIAVDCPTPKVIEKVVTELPTTGPTENMIFISVVLAVVVYFYARSRQIKKEVRLIRINTSSGTI